MLTDAEREMVLQYEPQVARELSRVGVTEADQLWLFAGTDRRPTREAYEAWLTQLRGLPTAMGVAAFCAQVLDLDYEQARRELSGEFDRGAP